ncbi:MAG: hypothetical protein CBD69_000235 [Crocinitomicaceae bacterium TMED209]|nr:MAG: hypothetical protein CBD69_000235 [Crocinitomicaceae bacterium TMED209]|tara:strand:+ start:6509 stop:7000 length:492 start_codon:yes stop_codon:yes gene_type:complete
MITQIENTKIGQTILSDIDQLINKKKKEVQYVKQHELKSILESVFRVTSVDVTERSNRSEVADAVKIFSFIAREHTNNNFKEIGEFINRDHSTIVIACNRYGDLYKTDTEFRYKADGCLSKFFAEEGEEQPKEVDIESINDDLKKCDHYTLCKIKNYIKRLLR